MREARGQPSVGAHVRLALKPVGGRSPVPREGAEETSSSEDKTRVEYLFSIRIISLRLSQTLRIS